MEAEEYDRIADVFIDTVYRVACSNCRDIADAQDVVQEVFLKLLKSRQTFTDDEHIRRWLIRVTVNECRTIWRSFWRQKVDYMEEAAQAPQFYEQGHSELYEAVMALSPKYRVVVHLYYYEGYSIREISDILNIRETTIQTRLMRARKLLKQQLEEEWQ